mgnify:CR=1 FL=1
MRSFQLQQLVDVIVDREEVHGEDDCAKVEPVNGAKDPYGETEDLLSKEDIDEQLDAQSWQYGFQLEFTNKSGSGPLQTFYFKARTESERAEWVRVFSNIQKINLASLSLVTTNPFFYEQSQQQQNASAIA